MLALSTLIVIPVINSYICAVNDAIEHSQGMQHDEIVNSAMGEMADRCCDNHSHHDLNHISHSHNNRSLPKYITAYLRPDNDTFPSQSPLAVERPPSI